MTAMKMDESRIAARLKVVEEHIRTENAHDLNGIMGTFGETPYFVLNHEHHSGYEAVHAFYAELIQGFPDLHIAVKEQHISHEAIVLEVVVSGTHTDSWRGIMATGVPSSFRSAPFSHLMNAIRSWASGSTLTQRSCSNRWVSCPSPIVHKIVK